MKFNFFWLCDATVSELLFLRKMPTFSIIPPFIKRYRRRAIDRIQGKIDAVKDTVYGKLQKNVDNSREIVVRSGILALVGAVIVWMSVFFYVAFYYAYMPSIFHSRPVHLQFDSCEEKRGICSYPSAQVKLTARQQLLMVGQEYNIFLKLEMPESPVNKRLGMFMACINLLDKAGTVLDKSCRSGMLHYKSPLLQTMSTLIFSPMMMFGSKEEKQMIILEMFNDFEEDQFHPVTDAYVEIRSRHIELYSISLNIHARFTGLRYLMYNWPISTAIIGIGSNLFFITIICALSWLRINKSDFGNYNYAEYEEENGSAELEDNSNDENSIFEDVGKQSDTDITLSDSQEGSEPSRSSFDLVSHPQIEEIGS